MAGVDYILPDYAYESQVIVDCITLILSAVRLVSIQWK